jgi:poly(A) polymerase
MSDPVAVARAALGDASAWIVGGALRDRLLGRSTTDLDLVVSADPGAAARRVSRAGRGPAFELSEAFGAWRVVGPDRAWQVDISPLQGASLADDLARRDFTVNALAEPLAGGDIVDLHGGREDLAAGRLRMVSPATFDDDPLRALRLARLASTLGFEAEPQTVAAARERAAGLARVSEERVFAELKLLLASDRALEGLELLDALELTPQIIPELGHLRGVEQNHYHHLDVHGHTLEVLAETMALERDPGPVIGDEHAEAIRAHLAQPLADDLTRSTALRLGALLHDIAKPQTQARHDDGSVLGFPGHSEQGADLARGILVRLRASERLRTHVAALTRHHLLLGFLVHTDPLDRRAIYRYLVTTSPVEVDVSLLSVADRLATRGRKASQSIERHVAVARIVLPAALAFPAVAAEPPLLRGDELAAALGMEPGPALGRLLGAVAEARYAGEVATADEAIALARTLR